ncbi:hypothetical protein PanWU01x14_204840 [Parasponia andersonii]|uniref:Uncharacterized protein n=1 Tax=Parasponia andersonii TaxID=3476 RepID=A0A2P5BWD7_PARAD|nr:hypothetical protein PanWU01x14_204840 [Parasponia andersonii]
MTTIQFGSLGEIQWMPFTRNEFWQDSPPSSVAEWNIECLVRSSKKVDFSPVRESRQEVVIAIALLYYTFQLQLVLGEK